MCERFLKNLPPIEYKSAEKAKSEAKKDQCKYGTQSGFMLAHYTSGAPIEEEDSSEMD
jgi:hypothetical protein